MPVQSLKDERVELKKVRVAKDEPPRLPLAAKLYIAAVILTGATGTFITFHGWAPQWSMQFWVYLLIGMANSGLVVTLPGVQGSISVNYVFTLLSMLQFGRPETLLLALCSVTAQTVWQAKARLKP